MKPEIKAQSYTLYTENGGWIGQIVITDDGFFGAVTDWGNFSFAWRAFGDNFKEFLIDLNTGYFASKMVTGFAYVCYNRKIDKAAEVFANKILPPLQEILKKEKEKP